MAATKYIEASLLLPDFVFVQYNLIVAKMLELKFFEGGNYILTVVAFVENAKREYKEWILRIYGLHSVVAALVHIDNVLAKRRFRSRFAFRRRSG